MPKFHIHSEVSTTYLHTIEAETKEAAENTVQNQEDDGVEIDSSPPEIIWAAQAD